MNLPEIIKTYLPANVSVESIFTAGGLDPVLEGVKAKVDEFTPNIGTAAGRKEVASFAYKIAQTKTFLDSLGKDLVADKKAQISLVDAERKRSRNFLDAMKDRARKPLTDWENEEKIREEKRRLEVAYLADWDDAIYLNAIKTREIELAKKEAEIARVEAERKAKEEAARLERDRMEREELIRIKASETARREAQEKIEAEKARAAQIEAELKAEKAIAEQARIDAIENARLEKERVEREKAEAEKKRLEEIETARLEAIEAAKRAEAEKARALAQAKAESEAAEKKRRDDEAKEASRLKEIADKKAANVKHQAKINNEILVALGLVGIDDEKAKEVIRAIVSGNIPHVQINY